MDIYVCWQFSSSCIPGFDVRVHTHGSCRRDRDWRFHSSPPMVFRGNRLGILRKTESESSSQCSCFLCHHDWNHNRDPASESWRRRGGGRKDIDGPRFVDYSMILFFDFVSTAVEYCGEKHVEECFEKFLFFCLLFIWASFQQVLNSSFYFCFFFSSTSDDFGSFSA